MLPAFDKRIEEAIREIDPHHILWLEGNTFAIEWKGFDEVLPNCVYAMCHYPVGVQVSYPRRDWTDENAMMCIPTGEQYNGSSVQSDKLERQFLRKAVIQGRYNTLDQQLKV